MGSTLWPTNGTFPGRNLRQTIGAVWGALTDKPLGARSGVVAGTPASIVSISGVAYTISPHKGVLCLETSALAGPYNYSIDSAVTGNANAADQSVDRTDLITVTMTDTSEGDASTSGPTFTYRPGSVGSTPAPPAVPSNEIAFAKIVVPRSGTGSPTITLVAPFAVAAGGILPVRTAGEYPANPYVGQYVDDSTPNAGVGLARWNGAAWVYKQYWYGTAATASVIVADSTYRAAAGWTLTAEVGDFAYQGGGVWIYNGSTTRMVEANVHMTFGPDSNGQRGIRLYRNATVVDEYAAPASSAASINLRARYFGPVSPGDTFSVRLFLSSSASNQAPEQLASKNQFDICTVD